LDHNNEGGRTSTIGDYLIESTS